MVNYDKGFFHHILCFACSISFVLCSICIRMYFLLWRDAWFKLHLDNESLVLRNCWMGYSCCLHLVGALWNFIGNYFISDLYVYQLRVIPGIFAINHGRSGEQPCEEQSRLYKASGYIQDKESENFKPII